MSLEEQKELEAEETSFVDSVLGGEESHSPEEDDAKVETEESGKDEGDELIPEEEEDFSESDDSIGDEEKETPKEEKPEPKESEPEIDNAALQKEIEGLQKRLHDTQAAFHKATGERAALKKELEELKAKEQSEDDWFSDDDRERVEKLEADIKESDKRIASAQAESEDIAKKEAVARWDAAAAPVIKAHPDFEKVMYEDLVAMIDPQKGNPQIRAAWEALPDKSPAAQYEFAKKALDILEFQRNPEAYKEKMRKEILKQNKNIRSDSSEDDDDTQPMGKEGLDMIPSADMPDASPVKGSMSFVDEVFGR